MSLFAPAPPPPTNLGRYRRLSPIAGVHVSPIQLGAANIGDKWHDIGWGVMDEKSSIALLDAYFDAGGNFIDTANHYQDERSEEIIGEWAEKRGIRDQLVIATKYTSGLKLRDQSIAQKVNYVGNNVKSMHVSVEASLKKLRTSYIDILYVHWWDWDTSVEEVMNGLHALVLAGKVLYLGVSDTPAWVVSKANQYARDHGKTPFVIYQGAWNVMERSFEREIIPMARSEGAPVFLPFFHTVDAETENRPLDTTGLALAPWNVVAGGKIRTDEEEQRRRESGEKGRTTFDPNWERTEDEKKVSKALEKVAAEVGAKHITAVAIAYLMQKTPHVFPIVGGRKIEHLYQNIEALSITLKPEQIEYLESIVPFDPGFPTNLIGDGTKHSFLMSANSVLDKDPLIQPIRPQ
ncbi:Aldo/keto reductase [Punctularia strigosozonata HHB-11173 SS5]|uniref:Aldo/keto reductase n=1 Tax=Punctularia strigosozonata (strain HHB-11173) TaxID=741275 RepID=UPI0004416B3B|nr:Aldo/keto reductase [Punctularia strigosozonata HHB-11173 SS5]EIN05972.1 Aldo/keto reductase [Punctularia strigosozonata HHB-11173 SS5]